MSLCRNILCTAMWAAALFGSEGSVSATVPPPSDGAHKSRVEVVPTRLGVARTASINVLFIGGSITRGSAATTLDKSFAQLVTSWLKSRFDTVHVANLGIGSTTSEFAAYRFDHDIGSFRPDVAIIDFAVNDWPNEKAVSVASIDALVYKLRRVNPQVRILYASTTLPADRQLRLAGGRDPRSVWAQQVVEANGGKFVDAGAGIWRDLLAGARPSTYYFADDLHPNDRGHALYAAAIEAALSDVLSAAKGPDTLSSVYIARTRLDTAHLADRDDVVKATTCARTSSRQLDACQQQESYYKQSLDCKAGDSFTVGFQGTTIGVVNRNTPDGGPLDCLIDGSRKAAIRQPAGNRWTLPQMIVRYLPDGNHVMRCVAGGPYRIGAFLISGATYFAGSPTAFARQPQSKQP